MLKAPDGSVNRCLLTCWHRRGLVFQELPRCQDVRKTWLNCKNIFGTNFGIFLAPIPRCKNPSADEGCGVPIDILFLPTENPKTGGLEDGVPFHFGDFLVPCCWCPRPHATSTFRSVPPSKGLSMNFECVQPTKKDMSSCRQATPPLFELM